MPEVRELRALGADAIRIGGDGSIAIGFGAGTAASVAVEVERRSVTDEDDPELDFRSNGG